MHHVHVLDDSLYVYVFAVLASDVELVTERVESIEVIVEVFEVFVVDDCHRFVCLVVNPSDWQPITGLASLVLLQ